MERGVYETVVASLNRVFFWDEEVSYHLPNAVDAGYVHDIIRQADNNKKNFYFIASLAAMQISCRIEQYSQVRLDMDTCID